MDTVGTAEGTTVGGGTNLLFLTLSRFLELISWEEMRASWGEQKWQVFFLEGVEPKRGPSRKGKIPVFLKPAMMTGTVMADWKALEIKKGRSSNSMERDGFLWIKF